MKFINTLLSALPLLVALTGGKSATLHLPAVRGSLRITVSPP